MSTLVRTWTCSLNNVPTQTTVLEQVQNLLYQLKTLQVAAGGVVRGSSDSVAAGTSDLVDRWAAPANIIRAAAGVAHSWIVIRHTVGGAFIECLIDYSTASNHLINVSWSSSAFSTGGSITNAPTATASTFLALTNQQVVDSALANVRYHTLRNTTGDFMFLVSKDGTGLFSFAHGGHQMSGVEVGDNHIWYAHTDYLAAGRGVPRITSSNCAIWQHTGAIAAVNQGLIVLRSPANNVLMATMVAAGSPVSGDYPAMPAIAAFTNRIKGTLVDVALAPTDSSILVGTEEPASPATSTTMIAGELWVPNGGVTPTL